MHAELNIYNHPTTTVFVDDSWDFLRSITWSVDRVPYRSFIDPYDALSYIEHFSHRENEQQTTSVPNNSHAINHALAKAKDIYRFAEPSVLVVDYSMPVMNGLELCSNVSSPDIKKVLLTGVADERVAVEALNNRLIDFYINKNETSLSLRLQTIINQLENRYFQDFHGWSRDSQIRSLHPYLFDSCFADYFEDVCEKFNAVEHYPLHNPNGFCLVDRYGKMGFLVVYNKSKLQELISQATQLTTDNTIIDQLNSGQHLPIHIENGGRPLVTTAPINFVGDNYACALLDRRTNVFNEISIVGCYDEFLMSSNVDFRRTCFS